MSLACFRQATPTRPTNSDARQCFPANQCNFDVYIEELSRKIIKYSDIFCGNYYFQVENVISELTTGQGRVKISKINRKIKKRDFKPSFLSSQVFKLKTQISLSINLVEVDMQNQ